MSNEYKYLCRVDSPEDLKKLTLSELPEYCAEVRRFVIESLSRSPGHLASSLGTVELAVALHYVFDAPADKLVWDVGHQAYAHKIITGRRDAFGTLRKLGGISGFPRPSESVFDSFTAGHASNSISAALGMSTANRLCGSSDHVVAIIGDGAMTGGLAFEGLNNGGVGGSDLLVILNDNRISIDKGTGALKEYLVGITTSRRYNRFKTWVWNRFQPGSKVHNLLKKTANALKHGLLQQSNLFESFGFRYFGPVDGHDVVSLVNILRDLREIGGPKLLHTLTVKGRGYLPAELDQPTWHAPGKFDPQTGAREGAAGSADLQGQDGLCATDAGEQRPSDGGRSDGTARQKFDRLPHRRRWQDVFGETMVELARTDGRIVGITPAMLSGSSLDLMMAEFPERTFDVGIAEGHAVTFAAGLAAAGPNAIAKPETTSAPGLKKTTHRDDVNPADRTSASSQTATNSGTAAKITERSVIPFCVVYSSFLQRAYDSVIHDIAIERLPVVLCIDRGGIVGEDGATHHGIFDLAALLPVPRLVISSPLDEPEMRSLMLTGARSGVPFVIRYPRGDSPGLPWRGVPIEPVEVGRGRLLREGTDVAVLSFGPVGHAAAEAAAEAAERGISVAHYDLRFAKPLDEAMLHEVGSKFDRVITVEDGAIHGGVGSAVADFFARNGYGAHVVRLGVGDYFVPHGSVAELHKLCGYDVAGILTAILQ